MDVNTVHIEGEATPISLSKRRKLNKSPNSETPLSDTNGGSPGEPASVNLGEEDHNFDADNLSQDTTAYLADTNSENGLEGTRSAGMEPASMEKSSEDAAEGEGPSHDGGDGEEPSSVVEGDEDLVEFGSKLTPAAATGRGRRKTTGKGKRANQKKKPPRPKNAEESPEVKAEREQRVRDERAAAMSVYLESLKLANSTFQSYGNVASNAAVAVMNEILDELACEIVMEIHRKVMTNDIDLETDRAYSATIDYPADIYGQDFHGYQAESFLCDNGCGRMISASRYAPHLEKCTGLSSNRHKSTRAARTKEVSYAEFSEDDDEEASSKRRDKKRGYPGGGASAASSSYSAPVASMASGTSTPRTKATAPSLMLPPGVSIPPPIILSVNNGTLSMPSNTPPSPTASIPPPIVTQMQRLQQSPGRSPPATATMAHPQARSIAVPHTPKLPSSVPAAPQLKITPPRVAVPPPIAQPPMMHQPQSLGMDRPLLSTSNVGAPRPPANGLLPQRPPSPQPLQPPIGQATLQHQHYHPQVRQQLVGAPSPVPPPRVPAEMLARQKPPAVAPAASVAPLPTQPPVAIGSAPVPVSTPKMATGAPVKVAQPNHTSVKPKVALPAPAPSPTKRPVAPVLPLAPSPVAAAPSAKSVEDILKDLTAVHSPQVGAMVKQLIDKNGLPWLKDYLVDKCGVVSSKTVKLCGKTTNCPQHTEDQRQEIRQLLLGDSTVAHRLELRKK